MMIMKLTPSNGYDIKDDEDATVVLDMEALRAPMFETHISRINFTYEWRASNLKRLQRMLTENWEDWIYVLYQDLKKSWHEAMLSEVQSAYDEITFILNGLEEWMKERPVASPLAMIPAFSSIRPMPRNEPGVVVIGAFNYPICIPLMAVAGSIAAGNPTILKPSELSAATANLMKELIPKYFEPGVLQVVTGGIPETTALINQEWGMIHFTGSVRVGKIVAEAAAKTLTPTVLELGGKSPCYIDSTAPDDLLQVANRMVWGKTINAGQACLAPDYFLVHESIIDKLLPKLVQAIKMQFGDNPQNSELGRQVSPSYARRAVQSIQEAEKDAASPKSATKVYFGGSALCDVEDSYVCPTVVLNPSRNSSLMTEEIFANIFPVVVVTSKEEAVQIIRSMPGTPLAFYCFTKSHSLFQEMTERCRSGSAVRNDSLIQFCNYNLPFGGLGTSGIGRFRGKYSFQSFSHELATMYRPSGPGLDFGMLRFHPYRGIKEELINHVIVKLPHVPVLHVRFFVYLVTTVGVACMIPHDAFLSGVRNGLASALEAMAASLRPSKD